MALGATRGRVLRMILNESHTLVLVGIVIGVPAAFAGGRLAASRLFGISPSDPLTFVAATALMAGVAAVAGFLPDRRAANVDPMVALRYE